MRKIAKQIDSEAEMDLPDKPPGMRWSRYNRLAERFEHQSTCPPFISPQVNANALVASITARALHPPSIPHSAR